MKCDHCDSTRFIRVNGKCNDLASVNIPHLELEYEGYLPTIGGDESGLGGDYIDICVCLDCGTIANWESPSDLDLKRMMAEANGEDFDEDSEAEATAEEALPEGPVEEYSLASLDGDRLKRIMNEAYGPNWQKDQDAVNLVFDALSNPNLRQGALYLIQKLKLTRENMTPEQARAVNIGELVNIFKFSDQLRWMDYEILRVIRFNSAAYDDIIEYFDGTPMLYREEVVGAILDLQKTHEILQSRV